MTHVDSLRHNDGELLIVYEECDLNGIKKRPREI